MTDFGGDACMNRVHNGKGETVCCRQYPRNWDPVDFQSSFPHHAAPIRVSYDSPDPYDIKSTGDAPPRGHLC